MSSFQLTFIFFRGVGWNHQPVMNWGMVHGWLAFLDSHFWDSWTALIPYKLTVSPAEWGWTKLADPLVVERKWSHSHGNYGTWIMTLSQWEIQDPTDGGTGSTVPYFGPYELWGSNLHRFLLHGHWISSQWRVIIHFWQNRSCQNCAWLVMTGNTVEENVRNMGDLYHKPTSVWPLLVDWIRASIVAYYYIYNINMI